MYPDNSSLFQVSSGTLISTVIAATIPAISINGLSENDSIVITFNSDKSLEVCLIMKSNVCKIYE